MNSTKKTEVEIDPQEQEDKIIKGLIEHLEEIDQMFEKNFDSFSQLNQLKIVRILNRITGNSTHALTEGMIETQTKASDFFSTLTEEDLDQVDEYIKSKFKPNKGEIN